MSVNSSVSGATTGGTLLVIDGHSLAFRAYFALPPDNFTTSSGQATNAVWGFASMLAQVIESEKPDHLAVAFDVKGGTFRNQLLPQYKGTRDAAPEDLLSQLPLIQEMLTAFGVTYIEKPGYEGDDIIGTLATMGEDAGYTTLVLSGDRDAFQLVDNNITVLYPGHHFKDLKHMTEQSVEEKYHVTPSQYPDLAAMRGETADNIPGVPGVGDGFAAKWINEYGSLDGIIANADKLTGKKGEAFREHVEQVKLNRKVNALVRDLDLGVTVQECSFGTVDVAAVDRLFNKLEFGQRTKSRMLKTFNRDGTANLEVISDTGSADILTEPEVTVITAQEQLNDWVLQYLSPLQEQREAFEICTRKAENYTQHNATDIAVASDHDANADSCATLVSSGFEILVQGTAKPGDAHVAHIVLLAANQAAVIASCNDTHIQAALQTILDTYSWAAIVHGYKEHAHLLSSIHIAFPLPFFDTKLAGYIVHPDFHADTLEQAGAHFLDLVVEEQKEVTQGAFELDDSQSDETQSEYSVAITRASMVQALARKLAPTIDERDQFALLRTIEMPTSQVLFEMEHTGAGIDMERLVTMRDQFASDARQAQEIAWENAGSRVNLQSPKQLQAVLFEEMGLHPTKKTKGGSFSTNASALQDMYLKSVGNDRANAFLGALLRHRETNKLKQIVQTLIDSVNMRDLRIHTTFEQTVAATGRLSSVDPNLQNIPNRNASGREIRSAFVPDQGYESLLSCDYSQVELRIMAHLSGDEALIEAFKSGVDFHKYVASLVYQLPVEDITSDQRSHVKAMSYGLAYGLSTYGLAQQLKISPAAADVLKDKYFATFGKVHTYLESLVATARKKGYTETMFERRRYFPGLTSTNRVVRDAAERGALNAPIQGSAADIMKIAMIRADRALRDAGVKSRIILQIHDELVVELAPGEAEQVSALVRDAMEHAVDLAVPLDVSIGIGADWQLAAH